MICNPPYPEFVRNDKFQRNLQYELVKQYKHIKSNSEAAHKGAKCLNESGNDIDKNVYSNRKSLHNYDQYKHEIILPNSSNNKDKQTYIFGNEFNTVKYSQSPFLNKLTNLKQKFSNKKTNNINSGKGHKSRNSMFPKSYTEVAEYPRREMEIYG